MYTAMLIPNRVYSWLARLWSTIPYYMQAKQKLLLKW